MELSMAYSSRTFMVFWILSPEPEAAAIAASMFPAERYTIDSTAKIWMAISASFSFMEAVAAKNLNGFIHHKIEHFAAVNFGDGALDGVFLENFHGVLDLVAGAGSCGHRRFDVSCRAVHHRFDRKNLDGHLRQLFLHRSRSRQKSERLHPPQNRAFRCRKLWRWSSRWRIPRELSWCFGSCRRSRKLRPSPLRCFLPSGTPSIRPQKSGWPSPPAFPS